MKQRALADLIEIFPSRLVLLLDELEKRGLLERQASPQDRRSHSLRLTSEGNAQLEAIGRGAVEQFAIETALSLEHRSDDAQFAHHQDFMGLLSASPSCRSRSPASKRCR